MRNRPCSVCEISIALSIRVQSCQSYWIFKRRQTTNPSLKDYNPLWDFTIFPTHYAGCRWNHPHRRPQYPAVVARLSFPNSVYFCEWMRQARFYCAIKTKKSLLLSMSTYQVAVTMLLFTSTPGRWPDPRRHLTEQANFSYPQLTQLL